MTVRTIDDIFRDFNIDGVPSSGPHHPYKVDIRDTLKKVLEGLSTFPDNRVIRLNNANTGNANNIVVSASVAIPAAAYQVLYVLNVTRDNTGPVTVSGAINRELVTNTSRPIPTGYLTPGMAVLCIDTGTTLRMLSYGDMEVLIRAAQREVDNAHIERLGAEAARDIAAGYASDAVSQGNVPIYGTAVGLAALEIPVGINFIRTNGYHSAGDMGEANYRLKQVIEIDEPGDKITNEGTVRWGIASKEIGARMFGARGDYIIGGTGTDDTQAFRDAALFAVKKANSVVRLELGTYLVTDTVSSEAFFLLGADAGEKPKIVFKNMAAKVGFDMLVTSNFGSRIGSSGVEYIAEGANIAAAVRTPKTIIHYLEMQVSIQFTRNFCRGANLDSNKYGFGWDFSASNWFVIGDCVNCEVEFNKIQGSYDIQQNYASQFADCAFKLDAAGAVLSARLNKNDTMSIQRSVAIGDRVFAIIESNDFAGCLDGIIWVGTELLFNEPKILNNLINCQRSGISYDGPDSISMSLNTIRRHRRGWKGATHDWFGISARSSSDVKITLNTAQPDEGSGAFLGTQYAYDLTASSNGALIGNLIGVGCDVGICLAGTANIQVGNTITLQNSNTDICILMQGYGSPLQGARNTEIGQINRVSTFSGTVLVKDELSSLQPNTMRNFLEDIQSSANIVRDVTRVNAPANSKKWREAIGVSAKTRSLVSDDGSAVAYDVINRNGSAVATWERRVSPSGELFENGKIRYNPTYIPNYTDDTTAAAGGVAIGQIYRTGSALKMRAS